MGQKYLITLKIVDVNSAETTFAQRGSAVDLDTIPDLLASLINPQKDLQGSQKDKIVSINGLWEGFSFFLVFVFFFTFLIFIF